MVELIELGLPAGSCWTGCQALCVRIQISMTSWIPVYRMELNENGL